MECVGVERGGQGFNFSHNLQGDMNFNFRVKSQNWAVGIGFIGLNYLDLYNYFIIWGSRPTFSILLFILICKLHLTGWALEQVSMAKMRGNSQALCLGLGLILDIAKRQRNSLLLRGN